MAAWLKVSTAVTVRLGPFLDPTDAKTEEVGLTPGIEVSKNHAAFGARNSASAVTHDAEGWYAVPLDTTDTGTLGPLVVKAHDSANHLPVWREFLVVPAVTYDALVAGSDYLTVDAVQIEGTDATDALGTAQTGDAFARIGAAGEGLTALGDARLANLDATVSSRGTADPGDAMILTGAYDAAKTAAPASTALTNATWTDARAGKLDFLTGAVATAAKLLSLVQSLARKDVVVDADIGGSYDDATDSLQAIRDRGDAAWGAGLGSGAITWTYTLTSTVAPNPPIADCQVWVTTDLAGTNTIASGTTNASGVVTFYLDAGTVYVWRQKAGWDFTNPDTEVVV